MMEINNPLFTTGSIGGASAYFHNDPRRECMVKGEDEKCFFHRWFDDYDVLAPSVMVGGHRGGEIRSTLAIIERKNGEVFTCHPGKITFMPLPEIKKKPQESKLGVGLVREIPLGPGAGFIRKDKEDNNANDAARI